MCFALSDARSDFADGVLADGDIGFMGQTSLMDGENLDLQDASFDAVICRFGLMFFPDPDRGLREMNRVLKPGGRMSAVDFAKDESPKISLASSIVRRRTGHPTPKSRQSTIVSLGAPGVLEQKLITVGFHDVESHTMLLQLPMASAAECARYFRDASPLLRVMLSPLSPQKRQEVWQKIEEALSVFEGPDGFQVPDEVLVAAGSAA